MSSHAQQDKRRLWRICDKHTFWTSVSGSIKCSYAITVYIAWSSVSGSLSRFSTNSSENKNSVMWLVSEKYHFSSTNHVARFCVRANKFAWWEKGFNYALSTLNFWINHFASGLSFQRLLMGFIGQTCAGLKLRDCPIRDFSSRNKIRGPF